MQSAILTQGLSKCYGPTRAVTGLDLAVPAGAVTGFLGPNGSGKTTTIRMLLGLIRPTAGSIAMLGLRQPGDRLAIARQVGAMVETPCHYDHLTGAENLEITRRILGLERHGTVDRALDQVGLRGAANRRVGGYSLGMRQRLGIARALLGDPRLLILDEPVNALDPDGIIEVRKLLRSLARDQGMTILLSSHLLAEVELTADHVALIAHGRLIAQAPLAELLGAAPARVRIGVADPGAASNLLARHGLSAEPAPDGLLEVAAVGTTAASAINALLVDNGISVFRLSAEPPSLEATYLALTADREAA